MEIPLHLLNILLHIGAGLAAMALGFYVLWKANGGATHRRAGQAFAALTLVVCLSAAIGLAVFRFMPLFAVLTLMVGYQLLSGWHVVQTKEAGPDAIDGVLLLAGVALAAWLLPRLSGGKADAVVLATLAGLLALMVYDAARWCFPQHWHASLWRYEHVYKLVAALFAMLSAAVGNTVRGGQPWSQLLPSLAGLLVIGWFWRRRHRAAAGASHLHVAQN
jgi:uncharacterized membrane protein